MAVIRDKYILDIETKGATSNLGRLGSALKGLGFAAAGAAAVGFARQIIESTRQFETYTNQLRLITNSQEELDALMNRLTVTAQSNRAAFGDTVELFTKLTLATEELNISQDRVIDVTQKFQQALAISGADAGTAAGAIRQFGQAMASGTVRGDEFNSIVEALGPALNIMARESGLTLGKLREMSQAGDLTAESFFKMIEGSKVLSATFNDTETTIGQLETAMSDAFDRMIVQFGKLSGVTELYKQEVKDLTRAFDFLAGTELAPVNLSIDELRNFSETGITAAAALEELNNRLEYVKFTGDELGVIFRGDAEEFRNLTDAIASINAEIAAVEKATAEIEAQTEAAKEQKSALEAVLAPHQKFIDQAKKFADTDYRTALEKANQRVIDAEIVIEQLHLAFERSNGQIDNFVFLLRGAQNELDAATQEVTRLSSATDELTEKTGLAKFYDDLIEGASRTAREQQFAQEAINKLKQDLASGKINVDQFAFAMERLNSILGNTSTVGQDSAKTFAEGWRNAFKEYKDAALDASSLAERAFRQTTQGLEDAIVNFARTGKFEWKEFVLGIQEELLRANIRQVILDTLESGGNLQDVMSKFGSISGGAINIPQAELNTLEQLQRMGQFNSLTQGIGGAAPVSTQVTYNIDAVDALSFKEMIARDPEFIHAVAEAGGRMSPRRG